MKTLAFILCAAFVAAQAPGTSPALIGKTSCESSITAKGLYGGKISFFKCPTVVKNQGQIDVPITGADIELALSTVPTIPSADGNALITRAFDHQASESIGSLLTSVGTGIGIATGVGGAAILSARVAGDLLAGVGIGNGALLPFLRRGQPPLDLTGACDQLAISLGPSQSVRCYVYISKPPRGAALLPSVITFELDAVNWQPGPMPPTPPVMLRRRSAITINPDGLRGDLAEAPMMTTPVRITADPVQAYPVCSWGDCEVPPPADGHTWIQTGPGHAFAVSRVRQPLREETSASEPTVIQPWVDTLQPVQHQVSAPVSIPLPVANSLDAQIHEALAVARPLPTLSAANWSYSAATPVLTVARAVNHRQSDPVSAEAHNQRGRELLYAGKYSQSIVEFQEALKLAPLAQAFNGMGFALHLSGDERAALDAYDRALTIDPAYRNARANRELTLRALGQTKRAQL